MKVKFFQIAAEEGALYGLDGQGRIWIRDFLYDGWELMESPDEPKESELEEKNEVE